MIISLTDDFDLDRIGGSGQCFRWNKNDKNDDESYRIIAGDLCLNIMQFRDDRYEFDCSDAGFAPECYGSKPLYTIFPVLITLPGTGIETVDDLTGKTVMNDLWTKDLQENIPAYNEAHPDNPLDFDIKEGSGNSTAVSLEEIGTSYDAYFEMSTMAGSIQKINPDAKIIEIPDAAELWKSEVWLVFSPVLDQASRTQIEADIDKLVEDGTFASLSEECFGIDHTEYYLLGESAQTEQGDEEPAQQAGEAMPENEQTEARVYTDQETVKKVQQALNEAGFSCGTPDGVAGNMTNTAIIDFKASKGLDAGNADITDALLEALGIAG